MLRPTVSNTIVVTHQPQSMGSNQLLFTAAQENNLPVVLQVNDEEEVAAEDEDDMGVIETYANYMPSKLKVGKVSNSSFFESLSGHV